MMETTVRRDTLTVDEETVSTRLLAAAKTIRVPDETVQLPDITVEVPKSADDVKSEVKPDKYDTSTYGVYDEEWEDDPKYDIDSHYDPDAISYYEYEDNNTTYEIQYYDSSSDTDSEFNTVVHRRASFRNLDVPTTPSRSGTGTGSDTDNSATTVVREKDDSTDRIHQLQKELIQIQKKTFTKWVNSHLQKEGMRIDDLFKDFSSGRKLIKLTEILYNVKLQNPHKDRNYAYDIDNVNISLNFLRSQTRLEGIGAEDIVDGNPKLILGLLWLLIQRFQIETVLSPEATKLIEDDQTKIIYAQDVLLQWCREQTKNYRGVNIKDFSQSWRDGLAFNALIHCARSDLIDYNALNHENHIENMQNAFKIASCELGIKGLLDPEDVDKGNPDEKSIMMYVASLYHELKGIINNKNNNADETDTVADLPCNPEEQSQLSESKSQQSEGKVASQLPRCLEELSEPNTETETVPPQNLQTVPEAPLTIPDPNSTPTDWVTPVATCMMAIILVSRIGYYIFNTLYDIIMYYC